MAFRRAPEAADAIPQPVLGPLARSLGGVVESRRIATANGLRGHAAIYVGRFTRDRLCLIQLDRAGGGAACGAASDIISSRRLVWAGFGDGFLHGVAATKIARVAFVDRRGRSHSVRLTRDGGFMYICPAPNGCQDLVAAVNGFDRKGRLVSHQTF
jgi:hypothetical protein